MRAAIDDHVHFSIFLAYEDDRSASYAASDEIIGVWEFSFVPDVNPSASKEEPHLVIEKGLLDVKISMDVPISEKFSVGAPHRVAIFGRFDGSM